MKMQMPLVIAIVMMTLALVVAGFYVVLRVVGSRITASDHTYADETGEKRDG